MVLKSKIDTAEREKRATTVASALASVRIENLEPGPEALAISERLVEGELTLQEFGAQIQALEQRISSNGR